MTSICILSFKPLKNDPRIHRQVQWLKKGDYDITILGPSDYHFPDCQNFDCHLRPNSLIKKVQRLGWLLSQQFERFYWQQPHVQHSLNTLLRLKPDIIIANELECLPLALRVKEVHQTKIMFDAHEYYALEHNEKNWIKDTLYKLYTKLAHYQLNTYGSQPEVSTTVSPGLIELYKNNFNLTMSLLTNAPAYQALSPSPIQPQNIQMIHHGYAYRDRQLEAMIEVTKQLPEHFHLSFMLIEKNQGYLQTLKNLAAPCSRISFIEPVPYAQIPTFINQFDIGLYLLKPSSLNNEYALPNKIFEFIQGRLAVAIAPSPNMRQLVETYQCGIIARDFEVNSMVEALNTLTPDTLQAMKAKAHQASQMLSAEKNEEHFLTLIHQLETGS